MPCFRQTAMPSVLSRSSRHRVFYVSDSYKNFHVYFVQKRKDGMHDYHRGEGKGWGGKVCLWKEGLSFPLDYHVNAEGLHHALGFLLHQKHVPRIRLLRQDLQALKQLVGDEHSLGRGMILVQEIDEAQDR